MHTDSDSQRQTIDALRATRRTSEIECNGCRLTLTYPTRAQVREISKLARAGMADAESTGDDSDAALDKIGELHDAMVMACLPGVTLEVARELVDATGGMHSALVEACQRLCLPGKPDAAGDDPLPT